MRFDGGLWHNNLHLLPLYQSQTHCLNTTPKNILLHGTGVLWFYYLKEWIFCDTFPLLSLFCVYVFWKVTFFLIQNMNEQTHKLNDNSQWVNQYFFALELPSLVTEVPSPTQLWYTVTTKTILYIYNAYIYIQYTLFLLNVHLLVFFQNFQMHIRVHGAKCHKRIKPLPAA